MADAGPSEVADSLQDAFDVFHVKGFDQVVDSFRCKDGDVLTEHPNYWLPESELSAAPKLLVQFIIKRLYHEVMRSRLDESFAGAEIWVQKYEGGRGLAFHFDKDEHALKTLTKMQHPTFSSILYLTGSSEGQRQSPTVLLHQLFDAERQCVDPEDPGQSALIFPRKANFLVFDGRLGHGVLDSVCAQERMTLLINWWDHQPLSIGAIPESLLSGNVLTRWPLDELQSNATEIHADPVQCAALAVKDEGDVVEVDEVLDEAGIQITGAGAVDGCCFRHNGLMLHPVADQMEGSDTSCPAAFVPASMFDSDSV